MKKNNFLFSVIALILLIISACDDQSPQEIFNASEYRIKYEETLEILNIENPQHVHSVNIGVVIVKIENGDIIITSVGEGRTDVYIGDSIGLSNQARINISVDGTGRIIVETIMKYDGRAVNPNIKYAVTINGSVGSEITQTRIDLQMNGTHFIVTEDMDVTSWFINLPSGLSARIFDIFASNPERGPNEVYILIFGIPLSTSSDIIKIIVPRINAGRNWDVYFNTRYDAIYNITSTFEHE